MKIHWFSPLPPAKTGIARFTEALIPALQKRGELTLWTDQPKWDDRLNQTALVRRFDPQWAPWDELNQADLTLYNIGNNRLFHHGIWEVSRRHAGIVILHDFCLQHFFADLYLCERKDGEEYRQIMAHYYGEAGREAASQLCSNFDAIDRISAEFPLTPLAVENALAVVVHNPMGLRQLACQPQPPVIHLPLAYSPGDHGQPTAPAFERRSAPPYELVTFGFIGPNRRLEQFLEAWASLPEKSAFHLHICGEVWDASYINARILELGLADLAKVYGYVSDKDLHATLMRANLAVNLRYPTMGEASLTQLLIWEHALPSLVTQVGWYATLQENTVAFVRPECEAEDICAQLRAFLKSPEGFAEMGWRGREILDREHAPDRYAEALMALAKPGRDWAVRDGRLSLAKRAGDDMRHWIAPGAIDTLAESATRAIWDISGNASAPGRVRG